MPDTQFKKTEPKPLATTPSPSALSDPAELLRPPFVLASRSQDNVLGASRVLVSRHGGGPDSWLVGNTSPGGGSQQYPDPDAWREATRFRAEMMPGTALVARALALPSGATEIFDNGQGLWKQHGVQGRTRIRVTWTDSAGTTASATATMYPGAAPDAEGAEETEDGASWASVQHLVIPVVRPSGAGVNLATAETWSEWVTVDAIAEDQGGARILHATLSEEVLEHVAKHDALAVTLNGAPQLGGWPIKFPQEEMEDGATFEEHRFGTHRQLQVSARQTERVGPKIAAWSAYSESTARVDGIGVPKDITSTTPVRISAGPNTAWDSNAVGFDITMSARAPENLPTRVTGAASCPVRCRAFVQYNQAGVNTGEVVFWSSSRAKVAIPVDQAVIGTTPTWVEFTGSLETNTASDDGYAIIQDFGKTTGDTLQVWAWDISYGDFSVGV